MLFYLLPSTGNSGGEKMNLVEIMKKIRLFIILMAMLQFPTVMQSQGLPNDRQLEGLKGLVKSVTEIEVQVRKERVVRYDTVSRSYSDSVPSHKRRSWVSKKVDSSFVQKTVFDTIKKIEEIEICDTLYYCKSIYSREGYLLNRILKTNSQTEYTNVVYLPNNNIKFCEIVTYAGKTKKRLRLFHYSDICTSPQLTDVTVVEYDNNQENRATLVEKIEYEYENEGESCREHHFSPEGKALESLKYESGYLTDRPQGPDTNLHFFYDDSGRLAEIQVYNADYDLLYTEVYEEGNGIQIIRRVMPNSNSQGEIRKWYSVKYDNEGNWISRTEHGKEQPRTREIKYYE